MCDGAVSEPLAGEERLVTMIVLGLASSADAQYFGRNKVQYRDFAFEVLQTEHFDVYFYPDERDAGGHVGRMAERWHARLSTLLQHSLRRRQPIVLYASHPDFQQTNVITGEIGEGTGGVTEGVKRRVVLPLAGTLAETDHVLGHELVHAFQYDMASRDPEESPGASSLDRLPLWFVEGMAEYLSVFLSERDLLYGPLPIEVALCADGGTAWISGDRPTLIGGDRRPVAGAGVTLRANLFGFAVAQIDLARPFQRPVADGCGGSA